MFKYKTSIGLDDVAVVPASPVVFSDSEVDLSIDIGNLKLGLPIISAAMDSVFSPDVVNGLGDEGGYSFLNLCGLISRYKWETWEKIYNKISNLPEIVVLQHLYNDKPVDHAILRHNLNELKPLIKYDYGVAATPQEAESLFETAREFGFKTYSIQSSFVSPFWKSKTIVGLDIIKYLNKLQDDGCTVMVGNVAALNVARVFIDGGIDALILGIGPGIICTTRQVLGIGAGHISSIAKIREYIETSSSNTRIIADGGIQNSGDIVKLLCTGAHAVILGSMFARTVQAPFIGYHWGQSAPHRTLPRGNMKTFKVSDFDTIKKLLTGPSDTDDGRYNLIHAIKNAFSNIGVLNIEDSYHKTSVVSFGGMSTEGKLKK
jgi:IMP dehydrogenase